MRVSNNIRSIEAKVHGQGDQTVEPDLSLDYLKDQSEVEMHATGKNNDEENVFGMLQKAREEPKPETPGKKVVFEMDVKSQKEAKGAVEGEHSSDIDSSIATEEDIEANVPKEGRLNILLIAHSEPQSFRPLLQMSKTMLKRGHRVSLLTTAFSFDRVFKLSEYHRSNPKWNFTLMKCDEDNIKAEAFLGRSVDNKTILPGHEKWAPLALNHVTSRDNKFDVVVCDVFCPAGSLIADQYRIPLVVNVSGTLSTLEFLADQSFLSALNTCPCCGCLCICKSCFSTSARRDLKSRTDPLMRKHLENLPRRMILCNSFWGLERATMISPNVRLTGGLAEPKYAKMVKKIR